MVGRSSNNSKFHSHGCGAAEARYRLKEVGTKACFWQTRLTAVGPREQTCARCRCSVPLSIVQADETEEFELFDINSGFAPPDPKYESWKPPADQIPMSGTGKDSRFTEEAIWSTKPMRPKRSNLGAYATDRAAGASGDTAKPKPKLDGTGTWGDFGVKGPAMSSPPEDNKERGGSYVQGSPVPHTIEGMNEVLKQRAQAAYAKSAAAYANASPSAGAKKGDQAASRATSTASNDTMTAPSPHLKLVPPHMRKLLGGQMTPVPSPTPEPARGFQAPLVTAPPATDEAVDIVALCQKRLDEQQKQKQKATFPSSLTTTNVTRAAQNNNEAVIQGELPNRPISALAPKPIVARPAPGNHYALPANSDGRRASSTTLVNDVDTEIDDEALADRLQAAEFGLDHAGNAHDMLNQELNHYKSAQHETSKSKVDVNKVDLYEKLHKVQEILWKQETMRLHGFTESKYSLYGMDKTQFQRYYASIVSAHLAQWEARRERIEQVVRMQRELNAKNKYTVDELLAIDGGSFKAVCDKVSSAHEHHTSALDLSSDSDRHFMLTEDDFNSNNGNDEQEFDSDGFGPSGDEEEEDEDDDDDDAVIFKGHQSGSGAHPW